MDIISCIIQSEFHYHLLQREVIGNSIRQEYKHMVRNNLVFLPLLVFEPEASWLWTQFINH